MPPPLARGILGEGPTSRGRGWRPSVERRKPGAIETTAVFVLLVLQTHPIKIRNSDLLKTKHVSWAFGARTQEVSIKQKNEGKEEHDRPIFFAKISPGICRDLLKSYIPTGPPPLKFGSVHGKLRDGLSGTHPGHAREATPAGPTAAGEATPGGPTAAGTKNPAVAAATAQEQRISPLSRRYRR